MRNLVKGLIAAAFLMMVANCQKEEFNPASNIKEDVQVLSRSISDEAFIDLLNDFRAKIQTLIADGILKGRNATGVLNRLNYVEKKFLLGQKEEAVNMLNELIGHLGSLYSDGVISQGLYEELSDDIQNMIFVIENDCIYSPTVIAINGLNANLPPSGNTALPPDIFLVYSYDRCGGDLTLSFSQDPEEQLLPLSCQNLGQNIVQVWATNPWGRQDYAATYVNVQDNQNACGGGAGGECAPIAISHDLVVQLNGQGMVSIAASELDGGSIDACGTGNLSFTARKAGVSANPAENITFYLEDTGQVLVELWASDGIHSSMVLTVVYVQDNIAPI